MLCKIKKRDNKLPYKKVQCLMTKIWTFPHRLRIINTRNNKQSSALEEKIMMIWNQVEASWSKEMQTRELMLLMTCNLMQHILERVEMMTYNLKLLTLVKGIQTRMFLMTCNPVELTLAKEEMTTCSHRLHILVKVEVMIWNQTELICK